jgi:DNA-binding helix-hairpin-helix protein with protein kinase domain
MRLREERVAIVADLHVEIAAGLGQQRGIQQLRLAETESDARLNLDRIQHRQKQAAGREVPAFSLTDVGTVERSKVEVLRGRVALAEYA